MGIKALGKYLLNILKIISIIFFVIIFYKKFLEISVLLNITKIPSLDKINVFITIGFLIIVLSSFILIFLSNKKKLFSLHINKKIYDFIYNKKIFLQQRISFLIPILLLVLNLIDFNYKIEMIDKWENVRAIVWVETVLSLFFMYQFSHLLISKIFEKKILQKMKINLNSVVIGLGPYLFFIIIGISSIYLLLFNITIKILPLILISFYFIIKYDFIKKLISKNDILNRFYLLIKENNKKSNHLEKNLHRPFTVKDSPQDESNLSPISKKEVVYNEDRDIIANFSELDFSLIKILFSIGLLLISIGSIVELGYGVPGDSWFILDPIRIYPISNNFEFSINSSNYPPLWSIIVFGLSTFTHLPVVNTQTIIFTLNFTIIYTVLIIIKSLFLFNKKSPNNNSFLKVQKKENNLDYQVDDEPSKANELDNFNNQKIYDKKSNGDFFSRSKQNNSYCLLRIDNKFSINYKIIPNNIEYVQEKYSLFGVYLFFFCSSLGYIILKYLNISTYYFYNNINMYFYYQFDYKTIYYLGTFIPLFVLKYDDFYLKYIKDNNLLKKIDIKRFKHLVLIPLFIILVYFIHFLELVIAIFLIFFFLYSCRNLKSLIKAYIQLLTLGLLIYIIIDFSLDFYFLDLFKYRFLRSFRFSNYSNNPYIRYIYTTLSSTDSYIFAIIILIFIVIGLTYLILDYKKDVLFRNLIKKKRKKSIDKKSKFQNLEDQISVSSSISFELKNNKNYSQFFRNLHKAYLSKKEHLFEIIYTDKERRIHLFLKLIKVILISLIVIYFSYLYFDSCQYWIKEITMKEDYYYLRMNPTSIPIQFITVMYSITGFLSIIGFFYLYGVKRKISIIAIIIFIIFLGDLWWWSRIWRYLLLIIIYLAVLMLKDISIKILRLIKKNSSKHFSSNTGNKHSNKKYLLSKLLYVKWSLVRNIFFIILILFIMPTNILQIYTFNNKDSTRIDPNFIDCINTINNYGDGDHRSIIISSKNNIEHYALRSFTNKTLIYSESYSHRKNVTYWILKDLRLYDSDIVIIRWLENNVSSNPRIDEYFFNWIYGREIIFNKGNYTVLLLTNPYQTQTNS